MEAQGSGSVQSRNAAFAQIRLHDGARSEEIRSRLRPVHELAHVTVEIR
jgi:hypothetical protein